MTDPMQLLQSVRSILLVDWPSPRLPRLLVDAGFTVFGFSPSGYSSAELVAVRPDDVEGNRIFPPQAEGENGFLVFRRLSSRPSAVDLVNIYRPAKELPGIISNHALPLGAKTVWLHPPCLSDEARKLALENGLAFVQGSDIAELAALVNSTNQVKNQRDER